MFSKNLYIFCKVISPGSFIIKKKKDAKNIEYKLSNTSGTIMRRIESITLIPPNNWPIWEGDIKFVCNDFTAGVVIIPIADITVAVFKWVNKLEMINKT